MYYSEEEARKLVTEAGLRLVAEGLVSRTWGNISARISETEFVITPSGLPYETLTPQDMVKVKIEDLSWEGDRKPSSEKGVHAAAYALRPEASFVIHTHQFYASVVGITGKSENGLICAGYGLPGTKKLKANVEKAIRENENVNSFLMHRHGAVCIGENVEDAFREASRLEEKCKAVYLAAAPREQGKETAVNHEFSSYGVTCTDARVIEAASKLKVLPPYLDDFAQIAGVNVKVSEKDKVKSALKGRNAVLIPLVGGVCTGEDAQAVSEILIKNSAAALYARAVGGVKPMGKLDALLQRKVYLMKYSKISKEK